MMEQTHLDAGASRRHKSTQMDRNAIICAGLIMSSCSVATVHCCGVGTQMKRKKNSHMNTYKKEKNCINAGADVPGIVITVISTPTLACFED